MKVNLWPTGPIYTKAIAAEREDLATSVVDDRGSETLDLADMTDEFLDSLLEFLERSTPTKYQLQLELGYGFGEHLFSVSSGASNVFWSRSSSSRAASMASSASVGGFREIGSVTPHLLDG